MKSTGEISAALAERLRALARRYETPAFLEGDPSSFMHKARCDVDRETVAFVASALSFGARKQFMAKIASLEQSAGGGFARWVGDGLFEREFAPGDGRCFYRFHSRGAMHSFFSRLRALMQECGSLGAYVKSRAADGRGAVEAICAAFAGAGGLVPKDASSACKRVCMFLRWMVRAGSPVDIGIWSGFMDKATLAMPLDVHVMRQSRALGLLGNEGPSMKTALALSRSLSRVFPGDPLRGDYALFGLGVSGRP